MGFRVKSRNPGDVLPPTIPANLTATLTGTGEVTVTWAPSRDTSGVAEYRVSKIGTATEHVVLAGEQLQRVWAGLPLGFHVFQVRAVDIHGNRSAFATSNAVEVVAGGAVRWTFAQAEGQVYDLGLDIPPGGSFELPSSLFEIPSGTAVSWSLVGQSDGTTIAEDRPVITLGAGVAAGETYTFEVELVSAQAVLEPAILGESQPEQYRTVDSTTTSAIGGVAWDAYYRRLGLMWENPNIGDYTGHSGTLPALGADVSQGGSPFSQGAVASGVGYKTFDATELVRRALATGQNKGFYLRLSGSNGPSVQWAGRLSANPPTLQVITSAGTVSCPCILSTAVYHQTATSNPLNGATNGFTTSSSRFGIVQFDLSGVTGTLQTATLALYGQEFFGSNRVLSLFELRPPTFQLGAGAALTAVQSVDGKTGVPAGQVALGIAAELGDDGLAAADGTPLHPDVYCSGHFQGTTFAGGTATPPRIRGFDGISYTNQVEILPDDAAPNTYYWRGTAVNVVPGSTGRGLFKRFYRFTLADRSDPRYPIDVSKKVEECYVRAYVMFEPDWFDKAEGIKCGLGITLQFGYWVDTGTPPYFGYWQTDGGNSNSYGDGMKHLGDCHDNVVPYAPDGAPNQNYYFHTDRQTYTYKGHMQFNLGGYTGRTQTYDGVEDPHWDVRRLQGYNYNIDAPDVFGQGQSTLGNLVPARIKLGRWYCWEQYVKMNTVDLSRPIYGKKDASFYDNYEANPDGIHRTWLNGVLIYENTKYIKQNNMDMGIQGAGLEWYTGGNGTTNWPTSAHFRINHVVVAKRYVGPRVRK